MNKHLILCVLTAIAVFPQAQTPLTITQSAGSATGEIRMQERRTNGQNYVGLKAPQSVATNTVWTLPDADGTSGQCLDTNGSGILAWHTCSGERMVSDYNWSQVVGAVTAGNVITLTFTGTACPAAATDTNYRLRLYETATPTSYELREITGGTCTRGGSGTLVTGAATVSYTNATATSASGGLQEAIFSVADGNSVYARAGLGTYEIYSDVLDESRYLNLICDGAGAFFVAKADNLKMIHSTSSGGPQIRGCSFLNTYSHASVTAIYTNNPSGSVTGTSVVRNTISGMDVCVHLATVNAVREFSYNQISDCTTAAVRIEASGTGGDAGVGLIGPGNTFLGNATIYGVEWRGPGNLKLHGNSFNGFVEQFHGELKMGVVNVSGTTVTRVSGTPFTASMIGYAFVANDATNSVASTISAWTSSSVMTLTSNSVTCTGCSYYVGVSGQLQIIGNTFDGGSNTTHSVRLSGHIPFFNFHIDDNFMTAYTVSNFKGITVEGRGWYHGHVVSNKIPTSTTGTTIGVDVSGGTAIDVNGNQCVNNLTCVNIGSNANQVTTHHNQCATVYTNNCVLSTSSTSIVHEIAPVTFAQLGALTAANSSTLYCSNCKQTSASSATCATGGSGARATRINGAWKCDDGSAVNAFTQGGNSFGATAELGTNDAYGLQIKTNNTGIWSFQTSGHLWASSNNSYDIGAGVSANSPRNIYAATSMVAPKIGRDTSASLTLFTDSADRWIVNSAGMFYPATDDTYDLGLTGTRARGVYAKFGEFYKSGSTYSSDYLTTRKYNILDLSGGSGAWDMYAAGSMVANSQWTLRDNAGSRALQITRATSGTPARDISAFGNLYPAKRDTGSGDAVSDSTFGDLGATGARWANIYGDALDLSGAASITGNLSAAVINATGSPAYRVSGTTVINASREATFAGLTIATGAVSGYVWTSDGAGVGSWQAAPGASLPVVDTTGIAKGSSDATKIVRFEVDGLTTGTTRVLTVPDTNMTLAGRDVANTFTAAQTYNSTVSYASTISSGVSPTTNVAYDFGSSSLRWATAYVGGVNASVASTFAGNLSITGGSSLILDRATRATNQQAYWTVGGSTATTGAWSLGAVPSGAVSTFSLSHNSTPTVTVSEGGQWDFAGVVTTGGNLSVTGSTTANRFNGTSTNPYQVSGTTIVDSSRNATFVGLTTSGAVSLASSTIVASSTFSSDLIATSNATYALGSSGVRWLGYMSTLNVSGAFTFNGTLTGDLLPTTNNVYVLGSSSAYWNAISGETIWVENSGRIKPRTNNTGSVGINTARFNKGWFTDLDLTGTITAPSGNTGFSGTSTVRDSAGTGTCTLIYSGGIRTGGTC